MLLWPMYFIKMPTSLPGAALGPEGRYFEMLYFFRRFMMCFNKGLRMPLMDLFRFLMETMGVGCFAGLLATCAQLPCSILLVPSKQMSTIIFKLKYNFTGITVTKELNATTRAVLDQIRVILIWAIYLIPFGLKLCLMQGHFHWTAVRLFLKSRSKRFTFKFSRLGW